MNPETNGMEYEPYKAGKKRLYFVLGHHKDGAVSEYIRATDAEFAEEYFRTEMHPNYDFTDVKVEEREHY